MPVSTLERQTTLGELLEHERIHSVYQPVVELDSGTVVGYEALARGPAGSELERPDLLFAAARDEGRVNELDWACGAAALQGALDAGLAPPLTLLVNIEPGALGTDVPERYRTLVARAVAELRVVVEITERDLTACPADMLAVLRTVRGVDWGIALDDVGADRRSLALMPLLRPGLIKLDLRLVQDRASQDVAEIVNAVNAQAERTGAAVLAEGIETEEHLQVARALGATLGQGWLFGRPGELRPAPGGSVVDGVPILEPVPPPAGPTPFRIASGSKPVRRGDKRLLLALSKELESQAQGLGEAAVVIAAFQEERHFTPTTAERYERLGASAAFVGALGKGMAAAPAAGVRGARLDKDDPIVAEWDIAVIGPHFAAAFAAQDLGDSGEDMDRNFDFVMTYDREIVLDCARSLLERIERED
jgi:EAL domain-containing protein (putative c-di-GMP-specific phosphodiesterase class I)